MKMYLWESEIVLQRPDRSRINSEQPSGLVSGYSVAHSVHVMSLMDGHGGRGSNFRTTDGGLLATAETYWRHFKSYSLCFDAVTCSPPYLKTIVQ